MCTTKVNILTIQSKPTYQMPSIVWLEGSSYNWALPINANRQRSKLTSIVRHIHNHIKQSPRTLKPTMNKKSRKKTKVKQSHWPGLNKYLSTFIKHINSAQSSCNNRIMSTEVYDCRNENSHCASLCKTVPILG